MEGIDRLLGTPGADALVEHFAFLAAGAEGAAQLRDLMGRVSEVSRDGARLVLALGESDRLEVELAPGSAPEPYTSLFAQHGSLALEPAGIRLLHGRGEDYFGDLEEDELEDEWGAFAAELGDAGVAALSVLIQANSDFWVGHPQRKNPQGAPLLVCLGHDDPENPDASLTSSNSPGELWLELVLSSLS